MTDTAKDGGKANTFKRFVERPIPPEGALKLNVFRLVSRGLAGNGASLGTNAFKSFVERPIPPEGTLKFEVDNVVRLVPRGLAGNRASLGKTTLNLRPTSCLDAALLYRSKIGWKIFPARMEDGKKWSWLSAEFAPGGENWGMTDDPKLLKQNFSNSKWRSKCGIGVPTGEENDIFDLEADTTSGHGVDGLGSIDLIEAKFGKLPLTLMGRSPTGSIHRIYRRPKVLKVWSSASFIGNGVDVKGDGGMFVAPPSVRADGAYEWINDEPIADAPQWLIEQIILQPSKTSTLDPYERYAREHRGPLDIEECWENLQYPGNVDDTILRVSAAMARRSVPVEEIERTIFAELRARIPESATWNWEDRVHLDNFRSKLTRLFRKEPALLEQQQNKPQWLLNWMRDNKLVEPKHPVATVEIICAADVKMRQKEWLWKGHLLRGALELLTGLPGLGKSQTQIHYMACVTAGLAWPDGASACEPMNVIMVTAEDALDIEVVPRLQAAGCNLKCIQIIKSIRIDKQKRQFLLAEDLTRLAQVIAQVGNVGLICIDPITAYMGGKMDSHKATEVRSQLGPLKDFSEGTNVVVSAITHPAKNTSARAIDQFIGSQAFIAAARIGHACFEEFEEDEETGEKTPTGRILFTNVKHNSYLKMPTLAYKIESVNIYPEPYLQIETSRVVWDKEVVNISAEQAIAAAKSNAKAVEKKEKAASEVVDFLRNIIDAGDGWCKYAEIAKQAEALGYSKSELRTAREHLEVVSKRKGGVGDDGWWEWGWEEKRPTRF